MTRKIITILALLSLVLAPAFAQGNGNGKGRGGKGFDGGMDSLLTGMPMEDLSNQERNGLLHMIQEEKLARDVYLTLFEEWGHRLFRNIARSEQRHMNAVQVMIQKYGESNPVLDYTIGAFTDPEMQQLYNELTFQAQASLQAAFEVGAIIEDLDIYDLKKYLKKSDSKDVRVLFQNLQKGSRNHLRAFVRQLERYQYRYQARYLSPEELEEILDTPMERGLYDADGKPYFGEAGW
ncbi:MAG: DUF2202 domain-containing protein [Candidatus Aminicenantaceae bacterium]